MPLCVWVYVDAIGSGATLITQSTTYCECDESHAVSTVTKLNRNFYLNDFSLWFGHQEEKNIALNFFSFSQRVDRRKKKQCNAEKLSQYNFSLELIFLWCFIVNRQEYSYKAFEALNCESRKFHFIQFVQYSKRFQKEVHSYEREDGRLFFFLK